MKKPALATALALLLELAGGVALAAGFDCGKATSPMEKTICASPRLDRLDGQLAQAYAQARQSCPGPAIRAAQRRWLRERRNLCADEGCLISAYQSRLAELAQPSCTEAPTDCRVAAARLIGSWKLVTEGGPFEEMAFTADTFNSWLYERPEMASARWRVDGCLLTIRGGEEGKESRLTLLKLENNRLSLVEEGTPDVAVYRRIR